MISLRWYRTVCGELRLTHTFLTMRWRLTQISNSVMSLDYPKYGGENLSEHSTDSLLSIYVDFYVLPML
jgi:hypothetical protein